MAKFSNPRYRVVALLDDGRRVVISSLVSRVVADKVVRLIRLGSVFKSLIIEVDDSPTIRTRPRTA